MRCTILAAVHLLTAAATAQTTAVAVGNGPLLCFVVAGDVDGEQIHRLAELEGDGPAREFWRPPANAEVLRRLDRQHLLVASYGSQYALLVLDVAAGGLRELAPGAPHGFVAVHGDDVLYLGDPRDDVPYEKDDFLYASPWREPGERRRLCTAHIARVPIVNGNLVIAVGADERDVWAISTVREQGRRLWTAEPDRTQLRFALSPGGERLAIGAVDAHGMGELRVLDVGSGAVVAHWEQLPIQVSVISSSTPTLEVGWHDDQHVVCSETRGDRKGLSGSFVYVRRDITSGDVTDETTYTELGLSHTAPATGGSSRARHFQVIRPDMAGERAIDYLVHVGSDGEMTTFAEREPRRDEPFAISPDGAFAIACVNDNAGRRVLLFSAGNEAPRQLGTGLPHSFVWLPAAR